MTIGEAARSASGLWVMGGQGSMSGFTVLSTQVAYMARDTACKMGLCFFRNVTLCPRLDIPTISPQVSGVIISLGLSTPVKILNPFTQFPNFKILHNSCNEPIIIFAYTRIRTIGFAYTMPSLLEPME
jgi:hypothetical protein